jgi:uncharacterized membrane protein YobD (UPF0266 family)
MSVCNLRLTHFDIVIIWNSGLLWNGQVLSSSNGHYQVAADLLTENNNDNYTFDGIMCTFIVNAIWRPNGIHIESV